MVRVREEEKAHPCHREISRLSGMQNPIDNLLLAAVHMHNRQDTAVYCSNGSSSSSGQMRQKGCSSSGRRKSREERVVHCTQTTATASFILLPSFSDDIYYLKQQKIHVSMNIVFKLC